MARKVDLSCLEKREMLNDRGVAVASLVSWGQHYEEVGALYDAVDFYEKADAKEALERLLDTVRDAGNVFLFRRISRLLGHEPDPDEWAVVGKRAEELGKLAFAAEANRLGGAAAGHDEVAS